ncbi:MAG: molybdopterin-dependent oxidoreductase [Deltaproteobacteria bacterium]|nr:molybdopterin-dependent oxidoreductase [Deltaproteobacteria bacterium]
MKLTRRNFIAAMVGGVAGIQITPLPWKFTDDVAIWTQNWPWVPVPPTGEFTDVSSVCNLCPGGCGISVRKVEDRAIKIEGRTDYPVNPGGVCPVGMGGLQLLYDETLRFTGPMKRVGLRGAGEFQYISWGEAFDLLAGRISALRKAGRPEAIAAVDGNREGTTVSALIERLMQAVGSPNYVRQASLTDTYRMGNVVMQGREAPVAYDLENADLIVSFGCGLLEGWGAPGRVMHAWGMWHEGNPLKRKTLVVQVESRASNTASKADFWVAPRPGTDGALALGMAHVIIKSGQYDADFVAEHAFGFDNWQSLDGSEHIGFKTLVLKKYSPDQVSKITGVRPDIIVKLAQKFVHAKAPLAIYGKGKDDLNGGLYEFMAVQSLNALTGRINRPGGVLLPDPLPLSPLPLFSGDDIAEEGLKKPRLDRAGTKQYPFTHSLINNFADAINKSSTSPVDTLLVFSANPAFTLPDGGSFYTALQKIPFIVSFSPYRDETANMADLILPDATYLEKMDDIVWPVGLQYPLYGLSKPVVEPLYDTRNCGDTVIELSHAIGESVGSAFPWENFEEVLQERVKGLYDAGGGLVSFDAATPPWKGQTAGKAAKSEYASFDEMWEAMTSGGVWYRPVGPPRNWSGLFKTPSGRFEFFSQLIWQAIQDGSAKDMGIAAGSDEACMAHYEGFETGADRSSYPLTMVPYEMINLASGWIPSPPFLYKTLFDNQLLKDVSFAAVNPKTAAIYRLKEGDLVSVTSPVGEVRARIHLFEGAMPGKVYMPLGFGHTGYDEFLKGKGVNPNTIVQAGKDPVSGYPVWWNTPVKLIKA